MKISGFAMVKNADKLYYPIRASVESILPIVDEFIVALGDCDEDDRTEEELNRIQSPKLKIIRTVWDLDAYPNGTENAHQTDLAKAHCTGDWLFYLQADEVVHEKYHDAIVRRCEQLQEDREIEGLLFGYRHFWGDYDHYQFGHSWYKNEIRIIRNDPEIHSWESAQSFRRIPGFDGKHYRQQKGTYKLKVARVDAEIYHYGWVRPPSLMQRKKQSLETIHKGAERAEAIYTKLARTYDYGPLGRARRHEDTHPEVMREWIGRFDWADQLNYGKKDTNPGREKHKHDRPKYRILTWVENHLLGERTLGGFKNYRLLDRPPPA